MATKPNHSPVELFQDHSDAPEATLLFLRWRHNLFYEGRQISEGGVENILPEKQGADIEDDHLVEIINGDA